MQKYLHNALLINRRKFDIRAYSLMTSVNGRLKGYFYQDGYLRTSSKEFSLNNLSNRMIHLTNDAVQKFADDYGKFKNEQDVVCRVREVPESQEDAFRSGRRQKGTAKRLQFTNPKVGSVH